MKKNVGRKSRETVSLNYHQKLIENDVYSGTPLDKKLAEIFYEAFLMFNTFSVSVMEELLRFSEMGLFKFHSRED
jgi:hypothetical protein